MEFSPKTTPKCHVFVAAAGQLSSFVVLASELKLIDAYLLNYIRYFFMLKNMFCQIVLLDRERWRDPMECELGKSVCKVCVKCVWYVIG